MRTTRRPRWPIGPHLSAYTAAGVPALESLAGLPTLGRRFDAVLRARGAWLNDQFLDNAADEEFCRQVEEFYEQVVPAPLFCATLRRNIGRVRRGVEHLMHSADPLAVKIRRCLNGQGVYSISGVGPAFWSAIAQSL